jgi:putative phosphoesterase
VVRELEDADHVVHAGDFDSPEAYERVRGLAPNLTACIGNLDPDLGLPEVATADLEGVRFVVTHGSGPLEGYEERVGTAVADHADGPTLGVSGHTHQVMDEVLDGHRVLNPGSATGADPASMATMMVAEVADGEAAVTVHEE